MRPARSSRRRVEARTVDIAGLMLPSWDDILERAYEPWTEEHIAIDTSGNAAIVVNASVIAVRTSDGMPGSDATPLPSRTK